MRPLKNNYILIDFENVQPKNLELLRGHICTLIVFVGANQKSIPYDFAQALQSLGENAVYQKIAGNGSNALDFHIAFYLGELATKDANACFHVISRDKGFDPLIAHLRQRKLPAFRHADLSEIPFVKISNASSLDQKIDAIVDSLKSRGTSRPRKIKTLKGTMNALFLKTLEQEELERLVDELKRRGHVVFSDQSVSYGPDITQH
ncbi:PIN domain-containing protein [Ruegeria sp. HKCCSA071]|uniref:PIN domain-containing protein n=1 Tax=unclassified Ruegeria TaxID=2625375 RepID=UPI0032AF17D7